MKRILAAVIAASITVLAAPVAAAPAVEAPLQAQKQAATPTTLAQGSRGENVRTLQARLSGYGYSVAVDGVFGPQTDAAVRHWQRANGLLPDGIVGPITSATLKAINGPADPDGLQPATRMTPPSPPVPIIEDAPPAGLDACGEMNYWRVQAGLPDQFSDYPRTGPRSQWGFGWRESNCRNDLVSSTGCCVGYWQIHTGNFTAPGYRAGIQACGVSRRSDILGNSDDQKRKQACVAKVLYDVSGLTPWRL